MISRMQLKMSCVLMDSGERENNERQMQLNRQHLAEWDAQLAQETRDRMALEEQHKQDNIRSYLEEINVHDRSVLEAQQRQTIDALVKQNRLTRISMLKRHNQENDNLSQ